MRVPNHIAIILDGNGRWAKAKGMPRGYGHIKGCANLETICDDIKDLGVKYLTVYAFSTENWKRSREEVEGLMKLFRSYLKKCMKSAEKNHMRVKVIGDPSAFSQLCFRAYDILFLLHPAGSKRRLRQHRTFRGLCTDRRSEKALMTKSIP